MKARVFISSAILGFREERKIAKELPSTHQFLEMWIFEEEGASSASLERSYEQPLEKSDLVIFLLGDDITAPVLVEVELAIQHKKRTLLILRDTQSRSRALQDAIRRLDVKYATYSDLETFSTVLRNAIDGEIVQSLQTPPQRESSDPKYSVLKRAFAESAELNIEPFVSPISDNRFHITELTPTEFKLRECTSTHQINVPLSSVTEAVQDGKEFTILLSGRVQWLTAQGHYKLIPSPPKDDIGVPKMSSPGADDAVVFQAKLREKGYSTQWNSLADIRSGGYEVAYDNDGKYFRCHERMRLGSVEILVARK